MIKSGAAVAEPVPAAAEASQSRSEPKQPSKSVAEPATVHDLKSILFGIRKLGFGKDVKVLRKKAKADEADVLSWTITEMTEDITTLQPHTMLGKPPPVEVKTGDLPKEWRIGNGGTAPTPVLGWGMPESHRDFELTAIKAEVSCSFGIV